MTLQEGDIVWTTVDRIMGTVVFMKIDGDGEGTVIESEIAPGRVKNIRDYVVPKKRVVCKVIRINGDRVDLSMRRVSAKEQKEAKEDEEKERNYKSILRTILKEKLPETVNKIESDKRKVSELLEEAKANPKILEKYLTKEESAKIVEILGNQKQKKAEVKKEIALTTIKPNGISLIKEILKGFNAKYIAAGKYLISSESTDLKSADNQLKKNLEEIESRSKKRDVEFSIKEK
ncbi:Translation initiation factor 2 subunit alpha [uncultured archaeon]|nr:Translation initiation factor 2 subunit alpha [uncultured archaeon]